MARPPNASEPASTIACFVRYGANYRVQFGSAKRLPIYSYHFGHFAEAQAGRVMRAVASAVRVG